MGILFLALSISIILIIFSINFVIQHFTCNLNLDCYRRRWQYNIMIAYNSPFCRDPSQPYSISLSISEDVIGRFPTID